MTILLKDIFGFVEHQEKTTMALGYTLILRRNSDNAVLNKGNTVKNVKIKINSIHWYLPYYTPSLEKQKILMNQIVKKMATELLYPEGSIFMKQVNTQNLWTFELGTQEGMNIPIWKYVVFQQSDREHDQNLNNNTFYRMPVTCAQCIIGSEKHPDSGILFNYDDDDSSQGYSEVKEAFRALKNDNTLQPNMSEVHFRSSNDGDNICYNIHSFDI